jgi:prepilin-type N-terminal cleavage/methylation domain-containing protein
MQRDYLTRRASGRGRAISQQDGFTLTEVLVALMITVLAVMGLAHTFGIGRGLIDRYATARSAMGVAQDRMERLRMESMRDLTVPDLDPAVAHPVTAVTLDGRVAGQETWVVEWMHDPLGSSTQDYKRVRVTVSWTQAAMPDSVELKSIFLAR